MSGPGGEDSGVGFVGLGQIGAPMARHLLAWPGGLSVCDPLADAVAPFAEAGAHVADDPAGVAEHATVISVMVRDDAQVWEVLAGDRGILASAAEGTVVVIHSTVEASTPAALAEKAAPHGVAVVDAPVSGGMMGAVEGTLAVMVGGDPDVVEQISGPLSMFASLVAPMGPVGAGTRAKLARNLITFASYVAVGEAQQLAAAAGLDLARLGEVVRHSDGVTGGVGAIMVRDRPGRLPAGDGLRLLFGHARDLGEKDLDLALALADELGLDLVATRLARAGLAEALGVPHNEPEELS